MSVRFVLIFLLVIFILGMAAAGALVYQVQVVRPQGQSGLSGLAGGLPPHELVFQLDPDTTGFIHADGSELVTVAFAASTSPGLGGYLGGAATPARRVSAWTPEGGLVGMEYGLLTYVSAAGTSKTCAAGAGEAYNHAGPNPAAPAAAIGVAGDLAAGAAPQRVVEVALATCTTTTLYTAPDLPARHFIAAADISAGGWLAVASEVRAGDAVEPVAVIDVMQPGGAVVYRIVGAAYPAWADDGETLAFVRLAAGSGGAGGEAEQAGIYVTPRGQYQPHLVLAGWSLRDLAWSPNGAWIAFSRGPAFAGEGIYAVEAASGREMRIYERGDHPDWR